jgi:ferritin-like metal-binding protein YciE
MKADAPDVVTDAALIAAAQKVEHYEIAGYGTARTFARQLGYMNDARLLQETLNEEGEADKKLTSIAEARVNTEATRTA